MAMTVRLQDEFGNAIDEVCDMTGIIEGRLPSNKDESYYCLRFIDLYGDTYFNQSQMEHFLTEWERLFQAQGSNEQANALYERVKSFAKRCLKEPHIYIKFIGD